MNDWLEDQDVIEQEHLQATSSVVTAEHFLELMQEGEFNPLAVEEVPLDEEFALTLDMSAPDDIELPSNPLERAALVDNTWRILNDRQKLYLRTLKHSGFDKSSAIRKLRMSGDSVTRVTVMKWEQTNKNFIFILKVMKIIARNEVIDRDRLLLRADFIAEEAMKPKAILHKGVATGHFENHPDVALRANEQLMKATGVLKEDARPVNEGPALIIQIVQSDGSNVIDVSPGVPVLLPRPDAS